MKDHSFAFWHRFYMRTEQAAVDYVDERVDGSGRQLYLDSQGSVSASVEGEEFHVWDERILDEQHRRFLNDVGVS